MEQETGLSSTESIAVSLGSAGNKSDYEPGVTATPVQLSERKTESIDGSGDNDSMSLLTLLSTPAPHLLDTTIFPDILDVEASSPRELETTVTESSIPSGVNIKKKLKQFEQEKVKKEAVLHAMPSTPLNENKTMSSIDNNSHEYNSLESENSSEVGSFTDLPYPNATPIIPLNTTDLLLLNTTEINDTESISSTTYFAEEVTLIPDMTLTPIWDTMTPPTPPQEFRADVEISGDIPVTTNDPDSSAESDRTAVPIKENSEETQNLTSFVASSDKEYEDQDLTTTTESPNSKEDDELTTPTPHTTTPPRPTETVLDRTGISGMRMNVLFLFSYN